MSWSTGASSDASVPAGAPPSALDIGVATRSQTRIVTKPSLSRASGPKRASVRAGKKPLATLRRVDPRAERAARLAEMRERAAEANALALVQAFEAEFAAAIVSQAANAEARQAADAAIAAAEDARFAQALLKAEQDAEQDATRQAAARATAQEAQVAAQDAAWAAQAAAAHAHSATLVEQQAMEARLAAERVSMMASSTVRPPSSMRPWPGLEPGETTAMARARLVRERELAQEARDATDKMARHTAERNMARTQVEEMALPGTYAIVKLDDGLPARTVVRGFMRKEQRSLGDLTPTSVAPGFTYMLASIQLARYESLEGVYVASYVPTDATDAAMLFGLTPAQVFEHGKKALKLFGRAMRMRVQTSMSYSEPLNAEDSHAQLRAITPENAMLTVFLAQLDT